jgi:hypothetical protein
VSLEDLARRDAAELLYRGLDAVVKDLPRIAEMATQEERAAVVKWLRTVSPNAPTRRGADELEWCADRIERGEHRREEKP